MTNKNKMLIRKIIIILILISTNPVFGQNHHIGLKGGCNLTNEYLNNDIRDKRNRTGFNCGLTYEYQINNRFNFGLDLLYFQKGFEINQNLTKKEYNSFNYDYLSIPVKGGFFIGDKVSGFVNIGIVPSILINAKVTGPSLFYHEEKKSLDFTDKVTKFDFGGLIEIGGNCKLGDKLLIFLSLSYQHSLTTVTNTYYVSNFKVKHYGITLSGGLKYILKN